MSMNRLLQTETIEPRTLWTQGKTGSLFGFQNDGHVDVGDSLKPGDEENIMSTLRQGLRNIMNDSRVNSEFTKGFSDYVTKTRQMIGIGFATACAYQHVFHAKIDPTSIIVTQLFVMAGLGVCIHLDDEIGHVFRADSFCHYTSLPLIIQDGKVHWVSNGCVSVTAWGTWQRLMSSICGHVSNSPTPSIAAVVPLEQPVDQPVNQPALPANLLPMPEVIQIMGKPKFLIL